MQIKLSKESKHKWIPPTQRQLSDALRNRLIEPSGKQARSDGRGRISFHRKATDEEIMQRAKLKYGSLTLRLSPTIRDEDGEYKALRHRSIIVKKIRNQGMVEQVLEAVVKAIEGLGATKGV